MAGARERNDPRGCAKCAYESGQYTETVIVKVECRESGV